MEYTAGAGAILDAKQQRRLIPPPLDCSKTQLLDFRDRVVNRDSVYRNRHMARMARNLWYFLGRQWIELERQIINQGVRGYTFRNTDTREGGRKRPTMNFIAPQVENEIARLGKKEFRPTIFTGSSDPRTEAAARIGRDVLQYKWNNLHWPELRELSNLMFVVCGTTFLRTGWDTTASDMVAVGAPNAVQCPTCQLTLASPSVDASEVQMRYNTQAWNHTETLGDGETESQVSVNACPRCESPTPMNPYPVSEQEAAGAQDYLMRPMGLWTPRGDVTLDIPTPFEMFPGNGGLDTQPWNCRVFGRSIPRDLEWIYERHPDCFDHDELQPQDPAELMRAHPLLGEWEYMGRYNSSLDRGIYDNHVLWTEIVVQPYLERQPDGMLAMNDGRYLSFAGDYPLENSALMVPYQDHKGGTKKVARVKFSGARFRNRLGELWGHSMVDDMISPQNRINKRDAMVDEVLDLSGAPNMLIPESMEVEGAEWNASWGSGRWLRYTPDPALPNVRPETLQGSSPAAEVFMDRDRMVADLNTLGGGTETEMGNVPQGVRTTSALVIAGENASQKRQPRERALGNMYEEAASHTLELLYGLRTEAETYEVDAQGASMTMVRQFRGADLCAQYDVRIPMEAGVDKGLYTREAAAEALTQDRVYDVSQPLARRKYLELRGLPEINDSLNVQIDRARKAGTSFLDYGTIPVVDPTIQDCRIFYDVLGEVWQNDDVTNLATTEGWPEVLELIAGWDKKLANLAAQDAAARAFPAYQGLEKNPQQAQMVYQQLSDMQMQQVEQQKQQAVMAAQAGPEAGMVAPQPVAPAPIPPPVFLPQAYEQRVFFLWAEMMQVQNAQWVLPPVQPGMEPRTQDQEVAPDLASYISLEHLIRFRATIEAYRLLSEEKMGLTQMGAPIAGAPGSPRPQGPSAALAGGSAVPGPQLNGPANAAASGANIQ